MADHKGKQYKFHVLVGGDVYYEVTSWYPCRNEKEKFVVEKAWSEFVYKGKDVLEEDGIRVEVVEIKGS